MHIHSARRVEARRWASQPLSIELVSKSSRSYVFVCRFASDAASQRRCCLKTVRAEGPYLRHQTELLSRLAESARSRAAAGEGDCLPHVLAYGIVGESPPRSDCGELLYSMLTWVEGATLSHLIAQRARERRPVPFSESLSLLLAVAVAFAICSVSTRRRHWSIKTSSPRTSSSPARRAIERPLSTSTPRFSWTGRRAPCPADRTDTPHPRGSFATKAGRTTRWTCSRSASWRTRCSRGCGRIRSRPPRAATFPFGRRAFAKAPVRASMTDCRAMSGERSKPAFPSIRESARTPLSWWNGWSG